MTLEELQNEISGHCTQIASLLKPGFQVSVIVNHPDDPAHEFIVTDTSMDQLAATIERGRSRPALTLKENTHA
jgi:hypothetical protein